MPVAFKLQSAIVYTDGVSDFSKMLQQQVKDIYERFGLL